MAIINGQQNLVTNTADKKVYWYFNQEGQKIHKTKEYFLKTNTIKVYPFYYRRNGQLSVPKIQSIEFKGWKTEYGFPRDFRNARGAGLVSQRVKILMRQVKRRFPAVKHLVVGINIKTQIVGNTLHFSIGDMNPILIRISKLLAAATQTRIETVDQMLSKFSTKIRKLQRKLPSGKLAEFLSSFDLIDGVDENDIRELTRVLKKMPSGNVKITEHFVETREVLNTIYLEDIIEEYKKLLSVKTDKEELWQKFFENHAWVLTHLFPYEVILRGTKAYLGGKSFENKGGKLLDFLFENGFRDNHALLEIKTHLKPLMKSVPYRGDDVFAISEDLSGGINQCLDYKDNIIRTDAKDVTAYDPTCILIIGQKKTLSEKQKKSFELARANQKNILIATFDEILDKLQALHKILIKAPGRKPNTKSKG